MAVQRREGGAVARRASREAAAYGVPQRAGTRAAEHAPSGSHARRMSSRGIDYSRFDHLDVSDDSDDDGQRPRGGRREAPHSGAGTAAAPAASSESLPRLLEMKTALEFAMKHEDMIGAGGPQPAFVKANPAHPRRLLREVFYTHPRDFVATPDPARGFCHSWGVHDVPESDGVEPDYNGLALVGNLYLTGRRPEHQFVAYLAERKSAALAAARPALEAAGAFRRDVTLLVELQLTRWRDVQPAPPTWRRLRLSGGLTLAALHDKVLAPSLGWTRNFHAHLFTDRADGAQFGAPDGQSVDQMHTYNNGWMVLDGAGTRVAELLRAPATCTTWETAGHMSSAWRRCLRRRTAAARWRCSAARAPALPRTAAGCPA